MVSAIGSPNVDYQIVAQKQTQLLAQFRKSPTYSQAVAYYQANISKIKGPEDLLKNRRLLTVALSAFQLESQVDNKGILRKLLTQDPSQKGSLAQQLVDPRFRSFALAFSSLRQDGGAAVSSPNGVNAVLAGYETNEFQKWASNTMGDPSLRQALFFQQTVADTIDISAAGKLLAGFENNGSVQQDVSHYASAIKQVSSAASLMADPRLLKVALGAFGIDVATVSTNTIQRILTEGPLVQDPLLQADPRFQQFAQTFGSLSLATGALHAQSSIDQVTALYQQNQFATAAASGDPASVAAGLGRSAQPTIDTLLADFRQRSGIGIATSYYQQHIGRVTQVSDLLKDPQLLNVALGAFNLDPQQLPSALVKQLLTNDSSATPALKAQAASLQQDDPDIAAFVAAFGSLNSDGGRGVRSASSSNAVTAAFERNQFHQSLVGKVQQLAASNANGQLSVLQILGNPTLQAVTYGALGLPTSTGALSVTQQQGALARAKFDPAKLGDPVFLKKFINQFLANATIQQSSSGQTTSIGGLALALLGGGGNGGSASDSGIIPIDISSLTGASSGGINLVI